MTLFVFALLAAACFLFLDRIAAPRLESAFRAEPAPASINRAVALGGVQFLRTSALIAAITAVVMMLLVWALTALAGATAERVGATIGILQRFRALTASLSPIWSGVVLVLCGFAMYRLSKRKAQLRVEAAFNRAAQIEFERVAEEFRQGRVEEVPPSDEMQAIDESLWKLQQIQTTLESDTSSEAAAQRQQISEVMQQLLDQRAFVDVRRRLNVRVNPDEVLDPPPVTRRERIATFFVSRGLVHSLRGGNRLMFVVSLALVIASVTGIASGPATAILDRRLVTLGRCRSSSTSARPPTIGGGPCMPGPRRRSCRPTTTRRLTR